MMIENYGRCFEERFNWKGELELVEISQNQIKLFELNDSTGTLKPVKSQVKITDPYLGHLNRINDIKRQHFESFKISAKGKRDIDLVFQALQCFDNLTDREIQAMTGLEISSIPARRADICEDNKLYKNYKIVASERRRCQIRGTYKMSWAAKRID